ncbi:MAG: hypothetical protein QOC96_98 [Acidobacteriota bacterium]|jgi:hypothetical protein|nr:hypothetical protein [Acidobacteriota bacterium]
MVVALLTIILVLAPGLTSVQTAKEVSDTQKKEFVELLKTLPVKGEFFTEEAIEKAGPYLPVLFALTREDIEKYDIYPFLALSSGLCDQKEHREYAVSHFGEIRHPILKLGWGAMLFNQNSVSPQIVKFLRGALDSKSQAKLLSEMLGPGFEDFQKRVKSHPYAKRFVLNSTDILPLASDIKAFAYVER